MTQEKYNKDYNDGYKIVPEIKEHKGVQCGKCGVRFDNNTTVLYTCLRSNCPFFMQVTF